jgi:hypothetical protein
VRRDRCRSIVVISSRLMVGLLLMRLNWRSAVRHWLRGGELLLLMSRAGVPVISRHSGVGLIAVLSPGRRNVLALAVLLGAASIATCSKIKVVGLTREY